MTIDAASAANASSAAASLAAGGATPLPGSRTHRTLDLEHACVLRRIGRDRVRAEGLRSEVRDLEARVAELEARPKHAMSDGDFEELKRCRYRLDRAVDDAEDAEQRGDAVGYFVRTASVLFKYYDILEKGGNAPMMPTPMMPMSGGGPDAGGGGSGEQRSILSYFMRAGPEHTKAQATPPSAAADGGAGEAAMPPSSSDDGGGNGVGGGQDDRASLFDRYLQCIDGDVPPATRATFARQNVLRETSGSGTNPQAIAQAQAQAQAQAHAQAMAAPAMSHSQSQAFQAATHTAQAAAAASAHGACPFCGGCNRAVQLQDGYVFCTSCHTVEYILVDHEKPSYKDPPKEVAYFAYKRINHFNEWLNQVQGKETTEIPEEVYDSILLEIKKQKLNNVANLTRKKVKDILKKLRINKYYEHVPHIINRINGMPSPHLSPELEDRLRHMFCQIQVPFLKHAPSSRKNFLSYSYCLHKMMQLLEMDQHIDSFPLLKSRDKLAAQDSIWQKICGEIGWDFIPSL